MESIKVNSSRMGQMTKHYSIGINGTTGNDLTLDSNGDGSLNILLPEGAIVTAVHVGGSFTNGSGTSQLQAGKTSDTDSLFAAAATTDLEGTADAGVPPLQVSATTAMEQSILQIIICESKLFPLLRLPLREPFMCGLTSALSQTSFGHKLI